MPEFPFVLPRTATIAAASTATLLFNVSSGETFAIRNFMSSLNTAGVNIVNMRDQTGRAYMLGDASNPLPVSMLPNTANTNERGITPFDSPLMVEPSGTLYIDIQNTTGGPVTITLAAIGVKTVG